MPHNTRLQVPPGEVWKFQRAGTLENDRLECTS